MRTLSLRQSLLAVALGTVLLLLVPAVAMQFTREVSWGPGDFLAASVLLFGTGAAAVLALRHFERPRQRGVAIAAVALVLALVWAELAVGLFH